MPTLTRRALAAAFAGLMAAALPLAALTPAALAQSAASTRITLIHFNDTDQMLPRDGWGGVAPAMTLIRKLRAENPNSILTFGGDMFSPSLMSGFDKGAHMVALTAAMGVEVAVLGNHEFDFGPDNTKARLKESKYPWLGANVLQHGQPFEGVAPSFIREVAGFKLGFFGVVTEKAVDTTSAGPTVTFQAPIEIARREAKALKAQGAELVIGLCHLEYTTEIAMLQQVPEIDVCLSGDDHIGFTFFNGRQLALEAASNLTHIGVVDLHVSRVKSGNTERVVWRPETRLISTAGVAPDAEMAALVKTYTDQLDASLNVEIGTAAVELDSRRATVRTREAAFANLLADSMRLSTGADIAITNGGGIRADRLYPAGHRFTRRDILSELPFGNLTIMLQLTGAQVKAALENGVSQVEEAAGRFPQVSGITFEYDPKLPPGQRVTAATVAGKPLDPAATYKLATNDFMARGGDGYVSFRDAPRLIDDKAARLMATTMMDYIEKLKTVDAKEEGRILRK
ncbi:MAG: 5'-nucleotidase C-terminal domain-containing protein [Thalassobaculales bacterium]